MSSGFISAGAIDPSADQDPPKSHVKADEWARAQQEIEDSRRRKEEAGRQEGGKSLFEVLEANKARKQEAFEESIRFKNQFRSLDEDEIEFLDSVLESTRAREAALRKETTEQLDAFRKQQEEADKAAFRVEDETGKAAAGAGGASGSPAGEEEQWTLSSRKRKKGREKEGLKGVKRRQTSSASESPVPAGAPQTGANAVLSSPVESTKPVPHESAAATPSTAADSSSMPKPTGPVPSATTGQPGGGGLPSLVGYGSDDDD
ncbi:hypothetical protein GP486_008318 [Trichoglossum hirsutum]|uniref:FAM192A/Fyv6 N-terminal domain-containing protein n=1 Tax=Trichoglossum hirsutum TaxID=265104 RepID=A0A9P8IB83_9PEZI|nr:hypothetical protein GP486_008318 [Trichoglossum hirsutum]